MSKIIRLSIPESKNREFAILCDSLDVKIISQYATESLFGDRDIQAIVKIDGNEIPEALKEEKLKEKFGKYFKED